MSLAPNEVDLWLAREASWRDPSRQAELLPCLSAAEVARLQRRRFPEGQLQQLLTRAMVRQVLSHYLPAVPPAEWRFEAGKHGRPEVAADMSAAARRLRFNIAHTRGLVALVVGHLPVLGVDVERLTERISLDVARRYFSAAEIAALETLPEQQLPRRLLRLWTLKEAWLKALGVGISGGLDRLTFHLDGEDIQVESLDPAESRDWRFAEFDLDDEFHVAVACRPPGGHAQPRIRLRQFSGQEQRAQSEQGGEADAVGEGGENHARG